MAIDFKAKLKNITSEKDDNPILLYDDLDRTSVAGPLRESQIEVLKKWYNEDKDKKDIVIKLHTGEGKTLVGLLILMSKLNSGNGPCLYVCPNKYLVKQVCNEAIKFGIPICTIGDNNMLPNEFTNGKRILITHVQKLFNGKSVFGIGNSAENVGGIILDDAHACLDSIRNSFVVSIKRFEQEDLFKKVLDLFEEELSNQGAGTYLDIKNGDSYDSIMMVPYWAWIDKADEVLSLLADYSKEKFLYFTWDLIKDVLDKCQAYISGKEIQIVPLVTPIELFGTFYHANSRILMSATTQDDIFFVKTLDFSVDAIKKPIKTSKKQWSGEKMILLPSLISDELTRDVIIEKFTSIKSTKHGMVSLVPTKKKQEEYEKLGAIVVETNDIDMEIGNLKNKTFSKIVVLANRYDGIDLPDAACRILIIDSMPFFTNMADIYEERCRIECALINKKMAQKIEQGLGRCVRSEKDYACILIIGAELTNFIRNNRTKRFFSEQTCKQVDIGLQIAEWSDDENAKPINNLISIMNQCLKRDEGWKDYYKSEMDSIVEKELENSVEYEKLSLERRAEILYQKNRYAEAKSALQKLIDKYEMSVNEKGWYMQEMARYIYHSNKVDANALQKAAFEHNSALLKPREGISYKRFEDIDTNRLSKLREKISSYSSYDELMLEINAILEKMTFGVAADKFEQAIDQVGKLLGFETQRPDKMIRKGPDNLWKIEKGSYLVIECKSEVYESREDIHKSEIGQMNNHCAWFETEYPDACSRNIMIIPTNKISYEGDFSHKVHITTKQELNAFKKNFKNFYIELNKYNLQELRIEVLDTLLNAHNLDKESIINKYSIIPIK